MKRKLYLSLFLIVSGFQANAQFYQYNVVWNTQSQNSSESMPCGGGDIGLNVWVENGNVLFYIAKSNVNSPDVKLVSHSDGKATLRLGSGASWRKMWRKNTGHQQIQSMIPKRKFGKFHSMIFTGY
jgi:hypothetical protein